MVTAASYTPEQFAPRSPTEVLVTSADSRIRIFEGSDISQKLRGFRNTSSQITASFSQDGKYIVCASEDSQVYVWKKEEPRNPGSGKSKSMITTRGHEHFPCKDVSVAITWPGVISGEPPMVQIHSKRHSKRSPSQPPSACSSPTREDNCSIANSKRHLPPLPKKNSNAVENSNSNNINTSTPSDEELAQVARTDSRIGESFNSASGSSSIRYGDSPSISSAVNPSASSWSSSWSWFDVGNSHGHPTVPATAWGLVIVTAGLGGEIRAYQNFGLPRRIGRQSNFWATAS